MNRYVTKIYWSDEDGAFVAKIAALPGCVAHGATMEEAAREIGVACKRWLESAARHGDPIPEPDRVMEEIERVVPILNVAKLARATGINQHTLASKLRRKSRFTHEEGAAILRVLKA